MKKFGYVRVAGANTSLNVCDTLYNCNEIIKMIDKAVESKVDILSFSELSITGYTCADMFYQDALIKSSLDSIEELVEYSNHKDIIFIIGAPLVIEAGLYNCAIVINKGEVLGVIPKTYIPNNNE